MFLYLRCKSGRIFSVFGWRIVVGLLISTVPLFTHLKSSPALDFSRDAWAESEHINQTETGESRHASDEKKDEEDEKTEQQFPADSEPEDLDWGELPPDPGAGLVDRTHGMLSEGILTIAEWLDSFFYDERIAAEENRTRVRLRLESFLEEKKIEFSGKAGVRLVLPHTNRRLQLIVAGDPDEEEELVATPDELKAEEFGSADEQNLTLSLKYAIKDTVRRYISARVGIRFHSIEPVIFVEGRFRRLFALKPWSFRFTERVRWYTDRGWESKTDFDIERPLSETHFFRTVVDGLWLEGEEGYSYNITFSLFRKVSRRRAVSYQWINSFQTEPNNYLETITLRLTYRQRIWRDWLFYEIAPQIAFPRTENYDFTPGILLRLETIVGRFN